MVLLIFIKSKTLEFIGDLDFVGVSFSVAGSVDFRNNFLIHIPGLLIGKYPKKPSKSIFW